MLPAARALALAPALALIALTFPGVGSTAATAQDGRGDAAEAEAVEPADLVERLVTARGEHDRAAEDAVLAGADALEPLSKTAAAKWAKRLEKQRDALPVLDLKPQRIHSLYEPELGGRGAGRYLVGGKYKAPSGVLLALHGSGGYGDKVTGHYQQFDKPAADRDWALVVPNLPDKSQFWTDEQWALYLEDLIEASLRTWPKVDPGSVVVTGFSGGSIGSWMIGAWYADRFGLVAPAGGGPFESPAGLGMIPNLRNTPMKIFQYDEDPRVPSGPVKEAIELMTAAREQLGGYPFEYIEHEGSGHNPPDGGMGQWTRELPDPERVDRPEVLCWQPIRAFKRQFAWLWYDGPLPGPTVVARLDAKKNAIALEVDGEGTEGLALLLDDDLVNLDKDLTVTLNGAAVFEGRIERSFGALLRTHLSADPALRFDALLRID